MSATPSSALHRFLLPTAVFSIALVVQPTNAQAQEGLQELSVGRPAGRARR